MPFHLPALQRCYEVEDRLCIYKHDLTRITRQIATCRISELLHAFADYERAHSSKKLRTHQVRISGGPFNDSLLGNCPCGIEKGRSV
jgi:hypothetical protein